jgi:hypothetical protein
MNNRCGLPILWHLRAAGNYFYVQPEVTHIRTVLKKDQE